MTVELPTFETLDPDTGLRRVFPRAGTFPLCADFLLAAPRSQTRARTQARARALAQQAIAELTGGGGTIRFSPADRALANLPTYFWVDGFQLPDEQAVARLTTGDQLVLTLRLEGVRWAFHDTTRRAGRRPRRTPERYLDGVQGLGRPWWPTHEGPNGELSPVSWTFRRGGRYVVTVTYEWTATATVNGQPLPPMRLTSSPPSRELLVDELRAVITR